MEIAGAIAMGFAAGLVAGMLGVGGGVVFVPGLVLFLGLTQLEAQSTSLVAIIPVALAGAVQQHRYGNLRLKDGAVVGALAGGGVLAGVLISNAVPERALELAFAGLMILSAGQLARGAVKRSREGQE